MPTASKLSETAKGNDPSVNIAKSKVIDGKQNAKGKNPSKPQLSPPPNQSKGTKLKADLAINVPQKVTGSNSPIATLIFVGIMAFLFHVSLKLGEVMEPSEKLLLQAAKRKENKGRSVFDPIIELMIKNKSFFKKTRSPCGLYLGASSIPDAGFGLFAGKKYSAGEFIRIERSNDTSNISSKVISHWSLLLKAHAVLSNVKLEIDNSKSQSSQRGITTSMIIATRDILEGEELFLSWNDHLFGPKTSNAPPTIGAPTENKDERSAPFDYVFANNLPSPEHFARADAYIEEARIQYFGAIDYTGKTTVKPRKRKSGWGRQAKIAHGKKNSAAQQPYKSESTKDIENGLKIWQRSVERYDPLVAKLLPTKAKMLAIYHQKASEDKTLRFSSSSLISLQNKTLNSLDNNAQCVSSLEWQLVSSEQQIDEIANEHCSMTKPSTESCNPTEHQRSCDSRSSYQQVVMRHNGFSKGDVVSNVPLLVMPQSYAQENPSALGICLSVYPSPSLPLTICPLGGIYKVSQDPSSANVEYRWNNVTMEEIPSGVRSLVTKSPKLSSEEEQLQKEILLKVR